MISIARFPVMVMVVMRMFLHLLVFMVMVRTAVMASIGVTVQNGQDDKIADEPEDTGNQHVVRLLDLIFFYHSMSSFNEKFNRYNVNEGDVEEGTQSLSSNPPKCEIWRTFSLT